MIYETSKLTNDGRLMEMLCIRHVGKAMRIARNKQLALLILILQFQWLEFMRVYLPSSTAGNKTSVYQRQIAMICRFTKSKARLKQGSRWWSKAGEEDRWRWIVTILARCKCRLHVLAKPLQCIINSITYTLGVRNWECREQQRGT